MRRDSVPVPVLDDISSSLAPVESSLTWVPSGEADLLPEWSGNCLPEEEGRRGDLLVSRLGLERDCAPAGGVLVFGLALGPIGLAKQNQSTGGAPQNSQTVLQSLANINIVLVNGRREGPEGHLATAKGKQGKKE